MRTLYTRTGGGGVFICGRVGEGFPKPTRQEETCTLNVPPMPGLLTYRSDSHYHETLVSDKTQVE